MFFHSSREAPERPADPEVRRANLHRVVGALPALPAAALRPPRADRLLSRASASSRPSCSATCSTAISRTTRRELSLLAGGIIVIAIVTGVLGVVQTLLSNQVGQRVMHDLRASVFRHLQRLSLAFFTRTRTGEVQSRISNDIGGVQSVVTNTATSIVSNVTTVVATMVGMLAARAGSSRCSRSR